MQRLVVAIVLRLLRLGVGLCFKALFVEKTLKLNYNSIYYRFFKGIKFSNPQMTVLALDE